MNELEQLKSIAEHLESIRSHSTAGTLSDLSEWLYNEAPQMLPLIHSAMQYWSESTETYKELEQAYHQLELNAELETAAGRLSA